MKKSILMKAVLIAILAAAWTLSIGFMLYREISDTIPRDEFGIRVGSWADTPGPIIFLTTFTLGFYLSTMPIKRKLSWALFYSGALALLAASIIQFSYSLDYWPGLDVYGWLEKYEVPIIPAVPAISLTIIGVVLLGVALMTRYIKISLSLRVPATWIISIMALIIVPLCITAAEVDLSVYDCLIETDMGTIYYIVQPKDTVEKIASRFGKTEEVEIRQLIESNFYRTDKSGKFVQFRDPAKIKAGERLFITYDWVFPPDSSTGKYITENPKVAAVTANMIPAEPKKTGDYNRPAAILFTIIVIILILAYIRRLQIRRQG